MASPIKVKTEKGEGHALRSISWVAGTSSAYGTDSVWDHYGKSAGTDSLPTTTRSQSLGATAAGESG